MPRLLAVLVSFAVLASPAQAAAPLIIAADGLCVDRRRITGDEANQKPMLPGVGVQGSVSWRWGAAPDAKTARRKAVDVLELARLAAAR